METGLRFEVTSFARDIRHFLAKFIRFGHNKCVLVFFGVFVTFGVLDDFSFFFYDFSLGFDLLFKQVMMHCNGQLEI